MNKRAIALAADSAITINDNNCHKVINTANKLMALSKFHPVAIMFCGNATYMGTPWEVIVKEYRHQRTNIAFNTLEEYKTDFISFLAKNNHFCTDEWQETHLRKEASRMLDILITKCNGKSPLEAKVLLSQQLYDFTHQTTTASSRCPHLTFDQLSVMFPELLDTILSHDLLRGDTALQNQFKKAFIQFINRSDSNFAYSSSTIVIAGYGEKEIFPHLRSFVINFGFGDTVLCHDYITQDITEINGATLSRFAQVDMINSFVNGIHPGMKSQLDKSMPMLLNKMLERMADEFDEPSVKGKIRNFDTSRISTLFNDLLDRTSRDNFSTPLINSLAYLDREDLADFVESLISLTGLNRRVSGQEEGVGGPTDVAIITKGDGLIWMKRKHYFNPDNNRHYFDNYFRH